MQSSYSAGGRYRFGLELVLFLILLTFAAPDSFSQRVRLAPQLHSGQILIYRIDFSSSRKLQTESRVTTSPVPSAESLNVSALLQVEVIEATAGRFRLKTYYSERDRAGSGVSAAGADSTASTTVDKVIEVSIGANGAASQIKGFEKLSPAQQFVWNNWLERFTSSMVYGKSGIHLGQKWQSSEPETATSPIAGLVWSKKSEYVRDERCPVAVEPAKSTESTSSAASDGCAVVFVRATLRQKSSPKNPTPEDYKLRNLRTHGTASGQNESILYISRASGLLIRATEVAQQSMDVLVELSDGSNQVHNTLDAKSRSEILLLSDASQAVH